MNYAESTRYLISLGNEIRAAGADGVMTAKLGLENITRLLEDLGAPQHSYPSVLIAGTNGKGSVSAMIDSILRAAGLRTGLYTSPHLVEITERIRVNGEMIPQQAFADLFLTLRERIERLLANGTLQFHPTYFECLTAMAMEYFRQQRVEFAVLEVGMGGRLDATNTVHPKVSVITQIDFDHERFLGSTITAIAGEKAGIIHPGGGPNGVVVSSAIHPEAVAVIRNRSAELNVRLVEIREEYSTFGRDLGDGLYHLIAGDRAGWRLEVWPSLRGLHQVENAMTAIAAVRELSRASFSIPDAAIQQGLATTSWPGRLELIHNDPLTFVDGAHNPAGARALALFWDEHFSDRPIILVYGAMRDKAISEIAEILFSKAHAVVITQPQQERAASPKAIRELSHHLNAHLVLEPNPVRAMERAAALALEVPSGKAVIFATGSLFLVGDLRKSNASA